LKREEEFPTGIGPQCKCVPEWQEMIDPLETFIQQPRKAPGPKNFIRNE
jgi:hypothetical protein